MQADEVKRPNRQVQAVEVQPSKGCPAPELRAFLLGDFHHRGRNVSTHDLQPDSEKKFRDPARAARNVEDLGASNIRQSAPNDLADRAFLEFVEGSPYQRGKTLAIISAGYADGLIIVFD